MSYTIQVWGAESAKTFYIFLIKEKKHLELLLRPIRIKEKEPILLATSGKILRFDISIPIAYIALNIGCGIRRYPAQMDGQVK